MIDDYEDDDTSAASNNAQSSDPDVNSLVPTDFHETEDGGGYVDFGDPDEADADQQDPPDFGDNLAEHLDDDALSSLASELIDLFEDDVDSCNEHIEQLRDSVEILGLDYLAETSEPFEGACAASFPLALEAVTQFQARAYGELCPSDGPVNTKIFGDASDEVIKRAQRVKDWMNFQIVEQMEEWDENMHKMLMLLPIYGSMFRKCWWDEVLQRPISRYIKPENFVVSYETEDLKTAPRFTHVIDIDKNELRKQQVYGRYRDIDIEASYFPNESVLDETIDRLDGISHTNRVQGAAIELLEMHVDLDLPGFEDTYNGSETGIARPYIVTLERQSRQILSIYRNWDEDDPLKRRINWFTHFYYLPGFGFYGMNLLHLMGNLQRTATTMLRTSVDASMYNCLPAGYIARGLSTQHGDDVHRFGEFKPIDAGEDIRNMIMPIPRNPIDPATIQLMELIIDSGRRLASIADMNIGDIANNEAPVGTTLAAMEQAMKVMSAIHKRLHYAQKEELRILYRLNGKHLPMEYPYFVEGAPKTIKREDFDKSVNVVPVSDPNITSEAQRVVKAQTIMQIAQQVNQLAPGTVDMRETAYRLFEAIDVPHIDKLVNEDYGPQVMDPATEEYAIAHNQPVAAYMHQDDSAHLAVHVGALQGVQADPSQAPTIPKRLAHIAEHRAQAFRKQLSAQMQQMGGMALPAPPQYDPSNPSKENGWQTMPPELENKIAQLSAQASGELQKQAQAMAQQMMQQMAAQQGGPGGPPGGGPPGAPPIPPQMMQIEQQKVGVQQQTANAKHQETMAKIAHDNNKLQLEVAKEAHRQQTEGASQQVELQIKQMELRIKQLEAQIKAQQLHQSNVQMQQPQPAINPGPSNLGPQS